VKTTTLLALIMICLATQAFGQSGFDTSQGGETGEKVLGSYFSTDIDSVSMTNGNLHVNIPVYSLPGREVPMRLAMDYNSRFFQSRPIAGTDPVQVTWDFMGWRKDTGVGGAFSATVSVTISCPAGTFNVVDIYWIEGNGTKHNFHQTFSSCLSSLNGITADSTDSELTRVLTGDYFSDPQVGGANDPTWGTATIQFKNGNELIFYQHCVYDPSIDDCWTIRKWESRTLNGNGFLVTNSNTESWTQAGTQLLDVVPLTDTVGRTVAYSTQGYTEIFTMQDSNGASKAYSVTSTSVPATAPDGTSMTARMVTAINLPNGRSYQLQYDGNGYLSKLILPSGAYIRYTYSRPPNLNGWQVATRSVSSDGTSASEQTTTYAFSYTYDSNGHMIIASTAVTDPLGGVTVHTFDTTGFSGLETSTQIKNSSGTVLKQVDRTWQQTISPTARRRGGSSVPRPRPWAAIPTLRPSAMTATTTSPARSNPSPEQRSGRSRGHSHRTLSLSLGISGTESLLNKSAHPISHRLPKPHGCMTNSGC
jgi:YD repeat-containing protein